MLANYLVLINNRLADSRNFPEFGTMIRNEATFFWRKSASEYQMQLIERLRTNYFIEVRKI